MKGVTLAVVVVVVLIAIAVSFALLGFVGMRADIPPSKLETVLAGHAMDASVARAAP